MNDNQLVGAIVLYVNGREFDCNSVSPKIMAGRKPVPSMNKEGRVRKKTKTIKSIGLSLEVFVDEIDDFDWESVEDARVVVESIDGGKRTTYIDCSVTDVSESYKIDGEATRSLEMFALNKIEE